MSSLGQRLAAGGRWFASLWHADITNPTDLARLRGLLVVAVSALGVVTTVAGSIVRAAAEGLDSVRPAIPTTAVLFAVMVYGLWRRHRNTDLEFALLIMGGQVFATVAVRASNRPGDVGSTALALIIDTVLAALFLAGRRWVVAIGVVTLLLLAEVLHEAAGDYHAVTDFGSAVVGLLVVQFTLRWIRDLAITALVTARVGEVTDPLTGLNNRRGLERLGSERWQEKARHGETMAALVIDVDHFKRINDSQGHAAGDEILRRLGEVLARSLRADDVAVRLGGEEFLVLCSVPPGAAATVAERLRLTIATELAPVTVSIGVHETLPSGDDDVPAALWSTVDLADRALYEAKASGRNRVVTTAAGR